MSKNARIRKENSDAIRESINSVNVINYTTVSELLPRLIAEGKLKLDHSVYTPSDSTTKEPKGIGRYLLYNHEDPANPFSIWVFALASRQKTSIHSHIARGTVTVLSESVSEKYYRPISEEKAELIRRTDRYRFHCNSDDLNDSPDRAVVHQLKRRKGLGEGVSITLHIYEMEAYVISPLGEKTERRNIGQIYYKETTSDGCSSDSYEQCEESSNAFRAM